MFLLDTNVISEIRKIHKGTADKGVEQWFMYQNPSQLFLNDIVLLEIKQGELLLRHNKDFVQVDTIKQWLEIKIPQFISNEQILPITRQICLTAAALHIPHQRDRHDALIAATALVHGLVLVTRNLKDFVGIDGLMIENPFYG